MENTRIGVRTDRRKSKYEATKAPYNDATAGVELGKRDDSPSYEGSRQGRTFDRRLAEGFEMLRGLR